MTTNTITDIGDDLVRSVLISTNTRPQKFLSEEKYDRNGKFVDRVVNFYDNLPFGFVEKGLLTETRNYRDDKNYTKTTYAYNDQGLPQTITDTMGNASTMTYDVDSNLASTTNALGQVTKSVYYSPTGKLTQSIQPNGKTTTYSYDGFENLLQTSETSPKNEALQVTSKTAYSYGIGYAPGITTAQTILSDGQPYNTITTTYDSFGRQMSQIDSTNSKTAIKYNTLDQIVQTTDPNSIATNFSYDDIGRVTQTQQGDVRVNTAYTVTTKRVFDNSSSLHAKTFTYDVSGRVTQVLEETSQGNYATNYTWNILGNLTRIQDAENNVRNFTYDTEGRLLKQEDLHKPSDTTFGVYQYTYDALGNLLTKTDPTGDVFTYHYDALSRPASESDGTDQANYVYDTCSPGMLCQVKNTDYEQDITYNKADVITSESKIMDGKTFTNGYAYNSLGQVTTVTLPDASTL